MQDSISRIIKVALHIYRKLKEYHKLVLLTALFLAGTIIGALIIKNSENEIITTLTKIFENHQHSRTTQPMITTLFNSLLTNTSFLAICFTLGLCCVGKPIISLIPLIRGLGFGMISGYLYNNDLSGIGYYVLIVFPGAVLASVALLLSCNESIRMSGDILAIITAKQQASTGKLRLYLSRYALIVLLSSTASIMDMLLTKAFSFLF